MEFAEPHAWRIPEHFNPRWEPQLEHNRDRPDDQFQPYGATVGHGLEWSRLLLHLRGIAYRLRRTGCCRPPRRSSIVPWPMAGRSMVRTALSTPPIGKAHRWSATGCTGCSPRPSLRQPRCGHEPAMIVMPSCRDLVGVRRALLLRSDVRLMAPSARRQQPRHRYGLARQAGPVSRGAGHPHPATSARPEHGNGTSTMRWRLPTALAAGLRRSGWAARATKEANLPATRSSAIQRRDQSSASTR